MRKSIVLIVLCVVLLASTQLFARDDTFPRWGVQAGLTTSSFGGDAKPEDFHHRMGFHVGGSYWYAMDNHPVVTEAGVRFTTKGATQDDPDYSVNLTYIDIFGKVKFEKLPFNFYPYVGVSGGFLLWANVDDDGTETNIHRDSAFMDFSTLVGIDWILFDRFTIGYEYNKGWTSVQEKGPVRYRNNVQYITIGFLF